VYSLLALKVRQISAGLFVLKLSTINFSKKNGIFALNRHGILYEKYGSNKN